MDYENAKWVEVEVAVSLLIVEFDPFLLEKLVEVKTVLLRAAECPGEQPTIEDRPQ